MKEVLYILGDVVHTLQRERGCGTIYLYSNGELFLERMLFQFRGADKAILAFQEALGRWTEKNKLEAEELGKLNEISLLCQSLPEWRNDVTTKKITAAESISHYSHKIIGPIIQSMVSIALNMQESDPDFVTAYTAFLQWKERIGLERTIGARGFIDPCFQNEELTERVSFLLSEQESYQKTYLALASEKQKDLVLNVLKIEEVGRLEQIRDELKQSSAGTLLAEMTVDDWYDLVSAVIDALHTAHADLIDSLSDNKDQAVPEVPISTQKSHGLSDQFEELFDSLPLFGGISTQHRNNLLQSAQTREFVKGKLVFLEGEPANRLYIVLKGWVKVFKGTVHGEETILQMLTAGDAIMESAVYLNTSFPVSSQIVEDATLLSIPAPVLREQIKNNNELALNLLATMSHRSQGLIRQIENARLKSVDERVGWFLLKQLLDQNLVSRCVELPYDKSLIASYLDMKRETFSRALKRMKEKGFKIENNTVVIPDLSALCDFCDPDLASLCARHGTEDCPNPHCSDEQSCSQFAR